MGHLYMNIYLKLLAQHPWYVQYIAQNLLQLTLTTSRDKIDVKKAAIGYSDYESDSESDDDAINSSYTGSETSSSVASRLVDDSMEYRLTGLTADASL